MAKLTFAEVDALLKYDPETGKLFWKERPREMFKSNRSFLTWNIRYAGKEAFTARMKPESHLTGSIHDKMYLAHRVVWLLHTARWPEKTIDHINGDAADNRISNLRDVSHLENMRNVKMPSHNKSGAVGVYWDVRREKWCAEIGMKGNHVHVGYFQDKSEAVLARAEKAKEYGFHANHGRITP